MEQQQGWGYKPLDTKMVEHLRKERWKTTSVGVFEWVPRSNGKGMKPSAAKYRVEIDIESDLKVAEGVYVVECLVTLLNHGVDVDSLINGIRKITASGRFGKAITEAYEELTF